MAIMKRIVFFLLALGLAPFVAGAAAPEQPAAANPFALPPPDDASPFFLQGQFKERVTDQGIRQRLAGSGMADYPKTKPSTSTSALASFTGFFTGLFSSVHLNPLSTPPTTSKLKVEPSGFSLQDRREINVTYSILNNTKKLTRIEYPTSQRIEILTYDSQGKVIDRWSDDRAFDKQEGIVVINPHERIEYQEKIPTREMKPGETYKVEAAVTSEPNFVSGQTVTPW